MTDWVVTSVCAWAVRVEMEGVFTRIGAASRRIVCIGFVGAS